MPRVLPTESYGATEASGKMSTLLAFMAIFPILSAFWWFDWRDLWMANEFYYVVCLWFIVFLPNYTYSPETIKNKVKNSPLERHFSTRSLLPKVFLYFSGVSSIQAAFFFNGRFYAVSI